MAADYMILGENAMYCMDSRETGLNNNVLIIAASGAGKTMSVAEPCLIQRRNSSQIVTLSKRRLFDKYAPVFEQRGYLVWDLNFVNPQRSTAAFDPLYYVHTMEDITYLAEAIILANPKKEHCNADPYWDEASVSLLTAEIFLAIMLKKTKGKKASFTDVLELHDSLKIEGSTTGIATSLDRQFAALEQADPNCYAISCWKSFRELAERTARSVYGTMNVMLDKIFSPQMRKMMAMPRKIDFNKMAQEKTILFVTSSAVNPTLHRFVNIFYAQAIKSLFEYAENRPDGRLPIPVNMLCDDFATGGRILNFPEYISIFREKQISVTMLLQSETQLEGMYGEQDATTIINNCDTYVYMGGMDLGTARDMSIRLNAPLEDVLYMPIGQEFVFRRGQRPLVTRRYDVERDPEYQRITAEYERRITRERKGETGERGNADESGSGGSKEESSVQPRCGGGILQMRKVS